MNIVIAFISVLAGFLSMEFLAWFTHKYIMHGFLWVLHKDHHIRDGRKFEWNDLFAVILQFPASFSLLPVCLLLISFFGSESVSCVME
jgi:beta-carotene 3-hydroxylase